MKIKNVMMLLLIGFITACSNKEESTRTLRSAGFSEITITGYKYFGCSKDDDYHTGFRAKNPVGEVVEGTVCCGLVFKSCTIRF